MALLDPGDSVFATSVSRGKMHRKSGRLNKLLTALVDVQGHPNDAQKLAYLHKRLHRWSEKNPKELANRGAEVPNLSEEIRARAAQLGVRLIAPGPPPDAFAFVSRVAHELNAFKEYGCGDAFMKTTYDKTTQSYDYSTGFARCIKRSKRAEVEARSRELKGTARGAASPFDSFVSPGEWKARHYAAVCARVRRERAGICVTFAKSAAHILTDGQNDGPIVEIVAYDNHAYVLVNRAGAGQGEAIPTNWTADPNVIIIDPWAASMGHECIYRGRSNYPYGGMLNPLTLVATWDPDAEE